MKRIIPIILIVMFLPMHAQNHKFKAILRLHAVRIQIASKFHQDVVDVTMAALIRQLAKIN